jgi:hypothetical protein
MKKSLDLAGALVDPVDVVLPVRGSRFVGRVSGNLSSRLGRRLSASRFQSALWDCQVRILLN